MNAFNLRGALLATVLSAAVNVLPCQAADAAAAVKAAKAVEDMGPVLSVEAVTVRVLPTFAPPSLLEITAGGTVNSGGWTKPTLRYRGFTDDGVMEFDLVAQKPEGIVTQALTPITATIRVNQPNSCRSVRVYAEGGSNSASLQ